MPLAYSVGLISAGALALEVAMMRLFSIVYWSHFAWMIISVAMLGYGVSGALVAMADDAISMERFRKLCAALAVVFGISSILAFKLGQASGFNPLEILWDPGQKYRLFGLYFFLFVPFLAAGGFIGLAFRRMGAQAGGIYFYDLAGAGIGAISVTLAISYIYPWNILPVIAMGAFAAAGLLFLDRGLGAIRPVTAALITAIGVLQMGMWGEDTLRPAPSPYKGLSLAMTSPSAEILWEGTSVFGLITVVEDKKIPYRHAPGLSLYDKTGPPDQTAIFIDGQSSSAFTSDTGGGAGFLDNLTWALPYHLLEKPRTLILGAGGGMDVMMAQKLGASAVTALEVNAGLAALAKGEFSRRAGNVFHHPDTRLLISESRRYVSSGKERYDIIQAPLLDSFGASISGISGLAEGYLYTVEAMEDYLKSLEDGGWLVITRWLGSTPRESLKILAAAAVALERPGVDDPKSRVAVINSWNTAAVLVKNGKITMKDVAAIKEFCARRGFDTAYFPGIKPEEANKVNVQQEAYLYLGAEALLGGNRESYIENYKFNISPPEDNRPYFNNYFRFSSFPELWSKGTQGGYAFLEHGYLTLLAAMAQILIFAPVFLVLGWLYVRRLPDAELSAARCAIYFSLLGMAFMQTELVFIQKYTLFLGLPVLSASATLASFLIFAGLGGRCSGALGRWSGKRGVNPVSAAVLGILFFLAFHSLVMPWVTRLFWDAPQAARFAIAFLAIGPLAFFMGMPFPTGVTRLAGKGGGLIALAWGANGFMSVAGAVFGLGLAIHWGFDAVLGISAVLYILAALVYKKNPALIQDRA